MPKLAPSRLRHVLSLAFVACLLSSGWAQEAEPGGTAAFFAPLRAYSAAVAAASEVRAAQDRLRQAFDPVALDANTSYRYFPSPDEADGLALELDLRFRPFVFGEQADLVREREIALERARLDYLETLTLLETEALQAMSDLHLQQEALDLAHQRVMVADLALRVTLRQLERGAGTDEAVRLAEQDLLEAELAVSEAQLAQTLAEATLSRLVGDLRLNEPPALPQPEGEPLALSRAALELASAQLAQRRAQRNLYPVLDAEYRQNLGGGTALSASFGTRNLEPGLGFDYSSSPDDSDLATRLELSLSLSISVGSFDRLSATSNALEAARAKLATVMTEAGLEQQRLGNAVVRGEERLELARLEVANAQARLSNLREREALGLVTALETQRGALTLRQASFALASERAALYAAELERYLYYAQLPSQALQPPQEAQP